MYILEHSYKIGRANFFAGEIKLNHWITKYLVVEENEEFYVVKHEDSNDDQILEVYKSFNEDELSLNLPVYLTMNDIGAIRFTIYTLLDYEDGLRRALDLAKAQIINNLKIEQMDIAAKLQLADKL